MSTTQNVIAKDAKAIREALKNNCLYVFHEIGDGKRNRIIGVKMVGPVDSDSRDMYVRYLHDGKWHLVETGDVISQG